MSKKNIILLAVFIGIVSLIILNREGMKRQVSTDMEREQRTLFDVEQSNFSIVSINNIEKNEMVTFEKRGAEWFVKEKDCQADESLVNRIVSALPRIRLGQEVSDWKPDFNKAYGFDKGLEIIAGGKTFSFGGNRGTRIAMKYDNTLYLSPFREKHVFVRHEGNWCKKVEEPETDHEPTATEND
jgi:hypothetical protein